MKPLRPWEHLPLPPPSEFDPSIKDPDFFYREFLQPLSKDFIKLMAAGLHVDNDAVEELRTTVVNVLEDVRVRVNKNPIVQEFQNIRYKVKYQEFLDEMETRKRPVEKFLKEFKEDNIVHRSYLVNYVLSNEGETEYLLEKWTVNDLKKVQTIVNIPLLDDILNKKIKPDSKIALEAMKLMAEDKMKIYNKSHFSDKIKEATREEILPPFNPGSSQQKKRLFEMIGQEPLAFSKDTGEASWGREQIEDLQKMIPKDNKDLHEFLSALVDYSYSSIIKTNFMEAFDRFTIDDKLHGVLKLAGAKSMRPTSNSPNLLNMPSTGSIYAKPLKKCFIAPKGYLVWSIDFSALNYSGVLNSNV